jgi:acetylornithine deacetylase/succinyl-diaminopimelate desuccinylase-like protein
VHFSPLKDAQDAALINENYAEIRCALSICKALRLRPEPIQVAFGSDAYRMNKAGIPTVVFGPGNIDVAHSNNEYVPIKELKQAKDFYYRIMKEDLSGDTDGSASL